jgi:predicted permease
MRNGALRSNFSLRQYIDYRDRAGVFAGAIAYNVDELSLRADDGARVVPAYAVSGNYFATLGLRPAAGRLLRQDDDVVEGASPVVVISHDFWRDRFDGDPSIVGRATVTLNGQSLTVIGVAPEGFRGTFIGLSAVAWFPLSHYRTLHPGAAVRDGDSEMFLNIAGRLAPGVTRTRAETALALTASQRERLRADEPVPEGVRLERMSGLPPGARSAVTGFVLILLAAAGLLLAISSVNVAGMMLARATSRGREIALRLAVGAGRGRIVRQLLTESLVLFAIGGVAGVLLAAWGAGLLEAVRPPIPVRIDVDLGVDGRVLAIASIVTLLTGMIFGLAPAVQGARPGALRADGKPIASKPLASKPIASKPIASLFGASNSGMLCSGMSTGTCGRLTCRLKIS